MHILKSILIFIIVVSSVYQTSAKPSDNACDECVNYNFESYFEELFTNEGLCVGTPSWTKGLYSTVDIKRPFEHTETFIMPGNDLSCVTSFPFFMTGGGTVQVKVYIDSFDPSFSNYFEVVATQNTATGDSPTLGFGVLSSSDTNFVNGWQTLSFTLFGSKTMKGHVSTQCFTIQYFA